MAASKRATLQSAEADRRCDDLSMLVDRARDQAGAVRQLAESLTETAVAVARVAMDLCRYHGYREAFESATRLGLVRQPPGPWCNEAEGELDLNGFLRALAAGVGDGQGTPQVPEKLDGGLGTIPMTDGCQSGIGRTDEVQQAAGGEDNSSRSTVCVGNDCETMSAASAVTGFGNGSSSGSSSGSDGHGIGSSDASGRSGLHRHLASATGKTLSSMHSASMPVMLVCNTVKDLGIY